MTTCNARGTLLRHFEDMYGALGAGETAHLVRAERQACDELEARCQRRARQREARRRGGDMPR